MSFQKELAAKIVIETIKRFQNNDTIEEVIFVCFDDKNYLIYKKILKNDNTI